MQITRIISKAVTNTNLELINNRNNRLDRKNDDQIGTEEINNSYINNNVPIRSLALSHHRLTDLSSTINVMYGLVNLLDIFTAFVHITTCVCHSIYLVNEISKTNSYELKLYSILALTFSWAMQNVAKSLLTIQFCNEARKESLDTVRIANELLLIKDLSVDDKVQLKMLVSQVRSRKVNFTATGFITLDYSFLSSMLGAVATYILVIQQFGPS
ncbi:hypothetical protein PR048_032252 [Dryococelus australis]|uniref:Gustatory receptor n=1 Tax=Dryococelus australis TaxID=614101 RepID=A0ABQ9G1P0_9NEOP|nr:hypothetical protein PR048_032252 [Dryococelus australis]